MEMNRERLSLLTLLIIPVAASVYYALQMPVSYDEAWTFLNFTQKGFTASATHYPAPNNHILHSLITNATFYLPWFSQLFKLRVSVLIFNAITLLALYRFVAKHFDRRLAIVVVSVSSVLFLNVYYSYMSRGYALVDLCFVLALTQSFNIIRLENNYTYWAWFALVSTVGFYTMPSFLYPFVMLNALLLYFRRQNIWPQIIANALILLVVFVLYLPIIANDGIGALTSNPYVKSIGLLATLKQLPYFYPQTIGEITGIHWLIIAIIGAVSVGQMYRSKDKMTFVFAIVMIAAPFVLLSMQRVIPAARIFCYYNFILVLIVAIPYRPYFYRMNLKVLTLVLLLFQCGMVFNFNRKINAYENKDLAANITASRIIPKIIGDKKYLFNFALLESNLEFELIARGYKNYTIKSVDIPAMSADTIDGYDYVIIKKSYDTSTLKPLFKTPYYNIYQKNQDRQKDSPELNY